MKIKTLKKEEIRAIGHCKARFYRIQSAIENFFESEFSDDVGAIMYAEDELFVALQPYITPKEFGLLNNDTIHLEENRDKCNWFKLSDRLLKAEKDLLG